jgi:hypothetical protein
MEEALVEVDLMYAQYLGQGIPSCYNCDRAYDGEDSKQLIAFWIRCGNCLLSDHFLSKNDRFTKTGSG